MNTDAGLRIGVVLDRFDAERGGAERYLARLLRELRQRGHQPRLYCMHGEVPEPLGELVPVRVRHRRRASREREFAAAAVRQARDDDCDVVYAIRHVLDADLYQPHGGTWAASMAARRRLARWPRWHEWSRRWSAKHRYFQLADREVFARNPGLLTAAVSPLVRDDVLTRYGVFEPDVRVLWPGIDLDRFRPAVPEGGAWRVEHGLTDRGPLALFVAHEFRLKGLDQLLEALPACDAFRDGLTLAVLGQGPVEPYRRRIRAGGFGDQVRFLGPLSAPERAYAAADVLLHPTHHDPCALVTLEALACGLPVLTTKHNGAASRVEQGGGAVVASAFDVVALAGAVDRLLAEGRNPERTRAAVADLGWPDHVTAMEALLSEAALRAGARS